VRNILNNRQRITILILVLLSTTGGVYFEKIQGATAPSVARLVDGWGVLPQETRLSYREHVNRITNVCDIVIKCTTDNIDGAD